MQNFFLHEMIVRNVEGGGFHPPPPPPPPGLIRVKPPPESIEGTVSKQGKF